MYDPEKPAVANIFFEGLEGGLAVAAAKDLYELAVLLVNLQAVRRVLRRGLAEMAADTGHDGTPDGQQRRHSGTHQDGAMQGKIVLDDGRLVLAQAGAFQVVQDALPDMPSS
jgi:hypothetical protein